VIREFKPMSTGSQELLATWDIVIGMTPEDPEQRRKGPPPRDSAAVSDQDIKDVLFGPAPF
jgi:hypothetical protein